MSNTIEVNVSMDCRQARVRQGVRRRRGDAVASAKGVGFDRLTDDDLQSIVKEIDDNPMKLLSYKTSNGHGARGRPTVIEVT
ncbi:hypothetical protein [Bifidobacterium eulemuris]|uniref:Uncharacterized protein n=1 Tax=Bifidobacterium eulemuris TaxID=1765219 RepID=A0A261FZM3_9BIFI|nr:hypothetical protein [Bifidobacterium eulemuris]OZG64363.1 hypothetical protein BEUL_2194 [Bifidobacterium eulemuris]QOL32436.1 hypothetical protein BE0216_08250 [Bifidobacterium eulemuris]